MNKLSVDPHSPQSPPVKVGDMFTVADSVYMLVSIGNNQYTTGCRAALIYLSTGERHGSIVEVQQYYDISRHELKAMGWDESWKLVVGTVHITPEIS